MASFDAPLSIYTFKPPLSADGTSYSRAAGLGEIGHAAPLWEIERSVWGGNQWLTFEVDLTQIGIEDAMTRLALMNEVVAENVFAGLVWEVEATRDGERLRWSMENIYNRIAVTYTTAGGASARYPTSGWEENSTSVARYGRRELIQAMPGKRTAGEAQAYAETLLAELSHGQPLSLGFADEDDRLAARVAGYWRTANNRYIPRGGTLAPVAISTVIQNIVTNYCDLIGVTALETNSTVTAYDTSANALTQETRAGDWVIDLVKVGDGTSPYVLTVTSKSVGIYYAARSATPDLFWRGRRGGLVHSGGGPVTADSARLGTLRTESGAVEYGVTPSEVFLNDKRDRLPTHFRMARGDKWPNLYGSEEAAGDMRRAIDKHLAWLERGLSKSAGGTTAPAGSGGR